MRALIDRYGCGCRTSDGDGDGLRDCSDASERVGDGGGHWGFSRDASGRDGDELRLVGNDLGDDRGIKRFGDAAAQIEDSNGQFMVRVT